MLHLKSLLIEFLNKKDITNGDVILTSIISSIVFLIIISILKPLFLTLKIYFKKIFDKICSFIKKKIRYYKGNLTFKDLIELEQKQKKGLPLTKREQELLNKNHKIIKDSLPKINLNINNLPNIKDYTIGKK